MIYIVRLKKSKFHLKYETNAELIYLIYDELEMGKHNKVQL